MQAFYWLLWQHVSQTQGYNPCYQAAGEKIDMHLERNTGFQISLCDSHFIILEDLGRKIVSYYIANMFMMPIELHYKESNVAASKDLLQTEKIFLFFLGPCLDPKPFSIILSTYFFKHTAT